MTEEPGRQVRYSTDMSKGLPHLVVVLLLAVLLGGTSAVHAQQDVQTLRSNLERLYRMQEEGERLLSEIDAEEKFVLFQEVGGDTVVTVTSFDDLEVTLILVGSAWAEMEEEAGVEDKDWLRALNELRGKFDRDTEIARRALDKALGDLRQKIRAAEAELLRLTGEEGEGEEGEPAVSGEAPAAGGVATYDPDEFYRIWYLYEAGSQYFENYSECGQWTAWETGTGDEVPDLIERKEREDLEWLIDNPSLAIHRGDGIQVIALPDSVPGPATIQCVPKK